jgi:hypothetical protein
MKFTKKDKKRIYVFFALLFIGLFSMQMGWLSVIGINPSPYLPSYQSGYEIAPGTEVYVKITTRIVMTHATTDLIVNMYDASGHFIDTCTTSSGVGTFSSQYQVGSSVWLQGRQAAPASADPYITPLTEFTVSSAGESADTVVLKNAATGDAILWFRDVSGSAATMVIRNGFDNNTIASTAEYVNTTDDAIKVSLTVVSADCYYGGEDFTDMVTGRQYDCGVFFVWKGTVPQLWQVAPKYTFSDPTNVYYIWEISSGIFYDSNGNIGDRTVTAVFSVTAGNTFADDATLVLDINDMIDISQLGGAGCLIDGGSTAVTPITTKIA